MPKLYADFKTKVTGGVAPATALETDLKVFEKWKNSPKPRPAAEYLVSIANTGQIDTKWSLMLNLGQIDGDRVNDTYVKDLIDKYFTTDLVSKGPSDPTQAMDKEALKAQVAEVRASRSELRALGTPLPCTRAWETWSDARARTDTWATATIQETN